MLTLEAVAERYEVEVATVRGWIRRGLLPAFRVGRVTRIAEEDEERFRRLHTWQSASGAAEHSARERSGAGSRTAQSSSTPTGERSYQAALSAVASSTRRERSERHAGGSRTSSNVVSVAFGQDESA